MGINNGNVVWPFRDIYSVSFIYPGILAHLARPRFADGLIGSLNLLGAFRGEAAADRAKLAAILQALGQIGIERPEVRSIDLNPLILEGSDPIVVDALVELEAQPGDGA